MVKLSKLLQKLLDKISKQLFDLENYKIVPVFMKNKDIVGFSQKNVQILQLQNMNKNMCREQLTNTLNFYFEKNEELLGANMG